jgi:protein-L-isoaspartate(D-aspartate) O-methyltransferase
VRWRSDELGEARERYAEELRQRCAVRSEALVRALATVRREDFLPRGPWLLLERLEGYSSTPTTDPREIYRDVAVAIDPGRLLNSSQPSLLVAILDALDVAPGERVAHLGCATGYYTAILAELVGRGGSVVGLEIDPRIAASAKRNLRPWKQVEVIHADALEHDFGPADVVLVDAGVTQPQARWLDALRPGGRMALPLTAIRPPTRVARFLRNNLGWFLLVRREAAGFSARFAERAGIAALFGGRDPERQARLDAAYRGGGRETVRSLRRDPHVREATCWFHDAEFCLSTREASASS